MSKNKISIVIPDFDNMALDRDVIMDQAIQEISSGSITPTALRKREFFSSVAPEMIKTEQVNIKNQQLLLEESLQTFQNTVAQLRQTLLQCSTGIVVAGEFTKPLSDVTSLSEKFRNKIEAMTAYAIELDKYLDLTHNGAVALFFEDLYENDNHNVVKRFGMHTTHISADQIKTLIEIYTPVDKKGSIKSKSNSRNTNEQEASSMLHPLEVLLIRNAIDSFKNGSPSILVDIFARNDDGSIKSDGIKPEMHTVVLYRQPTSNKVVVIDPSSTVFSKHLATNAARLFAGDEIISTASQPFKIYAPADKNNVGPDQNQYRDCTDIAVKIAFGLNRFGQEVDVNNILSLTVIQEITNQQCASAPSLFFGGQEAIARIRQASSEDIRTKANKLLVCLDTQAKSIHEYFKSTIIDEKIIDKNINGFSKSYSSVNYDQGIEDLYSIFHENIEFFYTTMANEGLVLYDDLTK